MRAFEKRTARIASRSRAVLGEDEAQRIRPQSGPMQPLDVEIIVPLVDELVEPVRRVDRMIDAVSPDEAACVFACAVAS